MASRGQLVVVTGPSGVGKSTVLERVLRRCPAEYSVSATTRSPRPGEVDGVDYHFVSRAEFERLRERGGLLEWAEVYGQLYGTPAEPVRQAVGEGRTVVMDLDVQGGVQVHEKVPDAEFVLILPPDDGELLRRLRGRGSEPAQAVRRRFGEARKEISQAKASGVYNHEIVNDDLDRAVEALARVLNAAER